jgi:hypothetical protein
MPIRINLLAETQIAEEARRRDPLKRAILVGILLVGAVLVWSSWVQLKVVMAENSLSQLEANMGTRTNQYAGVISDQRIINEDNSKLEALKKLTACRFLQGSLLNAIQHTMVPEVRLMRIRVDQSYAATAAVVPRKGSRELPKPATVTERIVVSLDAKDSSSNPGDEVNKYKAAVANEPYLKALLGKTNNVLLSNLSAPQVAPDGTPFVLFTLECHLPEQTR